MLPKFTQAQIYESIQHIARVQAIFILKEHWLQNAMAMSNGGIKMPPTSLSATRFCLTGAFINTRKGDLPTLFNEQNPVRLVLEHYISESIFEPFATLEDFNDCANTTHEEVKEMLEWAHEYFYSLKNL